MKKLFIIWVCILTTPAFGQDTALSNLKHFDHHIFSVTTIGNDIHTDSVSAFVSLSDIYYDSLAVPASYITHQQSIPFDSLKFFELEPVYRQRLLKGAALTEQDTLFLYDYARNSLEKAPLKTLKAIAQLTPYASEGDEIYVDSYMIGFEIGQHLMRESRKEYYDHVLVAIGPENPFAQQQLRLITWEAVNEPPIDWQGFETSPLYRYQQDGNTFFVGDVRNGEDAWLSGRKLLVLGAGGEVLVSKDFRDSEGVSLTSLNIADENGADFREGQWTGKLFKQSPSVVFGFEYFSFGCPSIILLDQAYADVIIYCDNRH